MKVPENFLLILLACLVYFGSHWVPELKPMEYILVALIKPDAQIFPARGMKALPPPEKEGGR